MQPAPPIVAILLGPYRNLSTLTAALLALHPNVQVLNHAGWRVLGVGGIDFLLSPDPDVLARFIDFATQASQGGRAGNYGGSILLSHAFDSVRMKDAYARRFGDQAIKQRVHCLLWKESLRVGVHLRRHGVDIAGLFRSLPSLRFVLPIRHPLDATISNLKIGHWSLFPQLARHPQTQSPVAASKPPKPAQVLRAILEEIRWFADLERADPDRCFHLFQTDFGRDGLESLARFLSLDPDREWLEAVQECCQLKASPAHPPELVAAYATMVKELFRDHPGYREALLRFTEPGAHIAVG